jgi:glutaconyl-CoA/methylmalonyl-CoA decarboxylase subunit delta
MKLFDTLFPDSARKKQTKSSEEVTSESEIPGEVTAAIAVALYLYKNETHDIESGVITIKRVSKIYSPWSSKLYHMRNFYNR